MCRLPLDIPKGDGIIEHKFYCRAERAWGVVR